MISPPVYLGYHTAIVEAFGRWPSFHDAVLLSFELRGATFECDLHAWNLTPEVDEKGFFQREKHHRVTLQFADCSELSLGGLQDCAANFGPNILSELRFSTSEEFTARRSFEVGFESAVGQEFSGMLRARHGMVLNLLPCDESGALL